jgi:hypothetical protein
LRARSIQIQTADTPAPICSQPGYRRSNVRRLCARSIPSPRLPSSASVVAWGYRGSFLGKASATESAAAAIAPISMPAIAVVPFKNLSSEPDSDYFVDGLTSEVIRNLAAIDGLQVRSQTSSFSFKDKARDVRAIGDQLGVNLIVEADVLRSWQSVADQCAAGTERWRRAALVGAIRSDAERRLRPFRTRSPAPS